MKAKIINLGSVEDIRCTLRLSGHNYSIAELEREIEFEKQDRNRSTVISILNGQIRRNKSITQPK